MKLTPTEERLVCALHDNWQGRQRDAREAETRIRQAQTPEARGAAVEAAQRLLRAWEDQGSRTGGKDPTRPGRPLTEDRVALKAEALKMRAQGRSIRTIAAELDIPRATVGLWLKGTAS